MEQLTYLEPLSERGGNNPAYRLPLDVEGWILAELQKRRILLENQHPELKLQIFLTMRTFKQRPLFIFGHLQEEEVNLLEAWCFRMIPPEQDHPGIQLVLDRAPLKQIFN